MNLFLDEKKFRSLKSDTISKEMMQMDQSKKGKVFC